jgi:hypothetical protein
VTVAKLELFFDQMEAEAEEAPPARKRPPRAAAAARPAKAARPKRTARRRVLDARPDTADFRDRMYEATLEEVPLHRTLEEYREFGVPILDQGEEGACTGFGLATVANYLLRKRRITPDERSVSPWMMYDMARRYDEWPGERYEGSSARGAMKGWHRHGVCSADSWPDGKKALNDERAREALVRPLGSYFRVNHKDLVYMHVAIAEVGVLYATSIVHEGWDDVGEDGIITPGGKPLGGHAFAIVGYDARGFWIQNSWGEDWGNGGFGHITYDDWLEHGTDVWVARLGVPIELRTASAAATARSAVAGGREAYSFPDLRPHIISLGNNGLLRREGAYGTGEDDVREILTNDFQRVTAGWRGKKRLLLYAHGGLVPESSAIQRIADYRQQLLENQIYPLSMIWKSDVWSTLRNILEDAMRRRRSEGFIDAAKDFILDRVDDALEPAARGLGGKLAWDEMKENARLATEAADGGARLVARYVADLMKSDSSVELHMVSHSAGSILQAPLARLLTTEGRVDFGSRRSAAGFGLRVASLTMWAPACTTSLFKEAYLPSIRTGAIRRFSLFTLTDKAERDDTCAGIYNKSLLYLVSNAFEERFHVSTRRDGDPILGMAKFVEKDPEILSGVDGSPDDWWVRAPNNLEEGHANASRSESHGAFDDDDVTLRATLARILSESQVRDTFDIQRSASRLRDQRMALE